MKQFYSLILLLLLFNLSVNAQSASCATMAPICLDAGVNFTAQTGIALSTADAGNNYGCLGSQPNPSWYYIEVAASGDIFMQISANTDIDFALWGPFSNLAAAQTNCGSYGAPVPNSNCTTNYIFGIPTGTTCNNYGCNFSTSNVENPGIQGAVVGQVYILLITNYANNVQNITLTQTGGVGATDCTIITPTPCSMTGLTANIIACNNNLPTLSYDISGTVTFTDPPTNGQLIIQDCFGVQQTFNAPFGTSQNYTITGLSQDGQSCPITAYFTANNTCTITTPVQAPSPITSFSVNCTVGGGALDGTIGYSNPPATGTLVVSVSDGTNTQTATFNPPFGTSKNWSVTGLDPAANPYTIDYYFSDFPSCNQTTSINCGCAADAGTTTTNQTGNGTNTFILCEGDQIDITTNGDYAATDDVGLLGGYTYQPGLAYLVYACPPTAGAFPGGDACFVSIINSLNDLTDINNGTSFFNTYGGANMFTNNNTLYYTPVTLYHYDPVAGNYILNSNCWDIGTISEVVYLNPIQTTSTTDCITGAVTVTITGGYPEFYGGNFTVSNLSLATATFGNTTAAHGGTITINGLQNGDNYSFDITDGNGCPSTFTGGPFTATPNADAGPDDKSCSLFGRATAIPSFGNGTWTSITPGVTFIPNTTDPDVTVQAPSTGFYDFVWTEDAGGGCLDRDTVRVEFLEPINITMTPTEVSCDGVCDGAIAVVVSGGIGSGYTYTWSAPVAGNTSNGVNNACSGNYTVTVTDGYGCTAIASTVVGFPPSLQIVSTPTNTQCFQTCDGSATLAIQGGTAPYSYAWSNGQVTPGGTNLCVGENTVLVTDANGCSSTNSFTLTEPPSLGFDSVVTNSNCSQSDGEICALITGGTPPYTYQWQNGVAANCIVGLVAGSYAVVVTDNNNCSQTFFADVSDMSGPSVSISAVVPVMCSGESTGSATTVASSGSGIFTYDWVLNGNSVAVVPNLNNAIAGTYTLNLTDVSSGCVTSATTVINEPLPYTIVPSSSSPSCAGENNGTASVNVSGATLPYTYQWTTNPQQNTANATGLGGGIFTVNINDGNNCATAVSFTLTNPIPVQVSVTNTDASCYGVCDGTGTATGFDGVGTYTYAWDDGQVSATAIGLCAGSHTVTVSDSNGCTASATIIVNEPSEVIGSVNNSIDPLCYGTATGSIQLAVQGGTPPYDFNWTGGVSTTNTAVNVSAGTHFVTITDGNGCIDKLSHQLGQPTELIANINTYNDVTCFGLCDGDALVDVSGGTPPYIYQWGQSGNLQQTAFATDLCANSSIKTTVLDDNGCEIIATVYIVEPTQVTVTNTPTQPHCGLFDGAIDVVAAGGTAPYTYIWPGTAFPPQPTVSGFQAGCYTVNVTDANNCMQPEVICLSDITGPTVDYVSHTNVTCFGGNNGSIQSTIVGGTSPYQSIQWTSAGNLVASGQQDAAQLSAVANYQLEVIDAAGCKAYLNQLIDQPTEVIAAVINPQNVSCYGGSDGGAQAIASGGTYPYTYLWGVSNQTTTIAVGLNSGIHTLSVTDANGCSPSALALVTITQPEQLLATTAVTDVSCFGGSDGSIIVSTTGGTGITVFAWTPVVSNFNSANALPIGSYSVVVTDANNCTTSTSASIAQPVILSAAMTVADATCSFANGTAEVNNIAGGTSPYTITWFGNPSTNNTITGLLTGNYVATVTDAQGCSVQVSDYIANFPSQTIDGITSTPPTCNTDCDGTATVTISGGTSPFTYRWSDIGSQATSTAINLCDGNYCVTVTDVNGCEIYDCVTIVEPEPFIGVGFVSNPNICAGESVQISVIPEGGNWPYPTDNSKIVWDNPALNYSYGPFVITPTAGATSIFNYTVTDGKGCTDAGQVAVVVKPELEILSPTSTPICAGSSVSICFTGNGGTDFADYVYTWLYDGSQDSSGIQTCAIVTPTATTWYYVTLNDGCSAPVTDSAQVVVNPIPPLQFSAVTRQGCPPLDISFNGVTSTDFPNATFQWDFNSDGVVDTAGTQFPTWTYENPGTQTVSLSVTSEFGCTGDTSYANYINVFPIPLARFEMNPDESKLIDPLVEVDATTTIGADVLLWNFIDYLNPQDTSGVMATHLYSDTGSYEIILTAINSYGCFDIDTQIFVVLPDFALYAPNAFTPNDDGVNDIFTVKGVGIDVVESTLYIYDRWGEIIYEGSINSGWDGKAKNGANMSPADVYIWKAIVKTYETEEKQEFIGSVTLVR